MADNHLWMNLEPRLKRYLSWSHPELKKYNKQIVVAVACNPKAALEKVIVWRGKGEPPEKVVRAREVASQLRVLMPLPSKLRAQTRSFLTIPLYNI